MCKPLKAEKAGPITSEILYFYTFSRNLLFTCCPAFSYNNIVKLQKHHMHFTRQKKRCRKLSQLILLTFQHLVQTQGISANLKVPFLLRQRQRRDPKRGQTHCTGGGSWLSYQDQTGQDQLFFLNKVQNSNYRYR